MTAWQDHIAPYHNIITNIANLTNGTFTSKVPPQTKKKTVIGGKNGRKLWRSHGESVSQAAEHVAVFTGKL